MPNPLFIPPLAQAMSELTEMDRVTGDGDLGTSMERAAKAVQGAAGSCNLRSYLA
ncbi:hypothetical protein [Edaphobacter modestus]|uniref:hypothetical protein n=1 Tax=Edaphobacter modestus TaxID=388466 RepID=UPI0013EEA7E3|nr:hypothetical protein [Edaphobacter modestus]